MDEGRNIIFDMCYTKANHENKLSNIALTKLDSSLCRIYEKVVDTVIYRESECDMLVHYEYRH